MLDQNLVKQLVRYYVYLMCFLSAIALLGFSTQPLLIRILLWLFFCLVVYRSIYNRYFMKETDKMYLKKVWPSLYESDNLSCTHVLLTVFVLLAVWGVTYGALETIPILKPHTFFISSVNGLIYSLFYFAQALEN